MPSRLAIKSAAVPHYSKCNNKIYFAVRVCPEGNSTAGPSDPYTVYRRWDEFQDLSAKLASAFSSSPASGNSGQVIASPCESDSESVATSDSSTPSSAVRPEHSQPHEFRNTRVPRLSRKVTLFVTTATHLARRDELDLYVRHIFSLPRAVTTYPALVEFFSIRSNGLDGRAPPSPKTGQVTGSSTTSLTSAETLGVFPSQPFAEVPSASTVAKTLRKAKSRDCLTATSGSGSAASGATSAGTTLRDPSGSGIGFRPTLLAKRSTPDLRRFIATSAASSSPSTSASPSASASRSSSPLQSPKTTRKLADDIPPVPAYPSHLSFKFPRAAPSPPGSDPEAAPSSGASQLQQRRVRQASAASTIGRERGQPRVMGSRDTTSAGAAVPDTENGSGSSSSSSSSDSASMRTASTIKPTRSGSTSRISSPLSFFSTTGTAEEPTSPTTFQTPSPMSSRPPSRNGIVSPPRPSPGALKHFRSLQDIRTVISPHPRLPPSPLPLQPFASSPVYSANVAHAIDAHASTTPLASTSSSSSHHLRGPSASSELSIGHPRPPASTAAPGMMRTRSDSRLLTMKPLPEVLEDESDYVNVPSARTAVDLSELAPEPALSPVSPSVPTSLSRSTSEGQPRRESSSSTSSTCSSASSSLMYGSAYNPTYRIPPSRADLPGADVREGLSSPLVLDTSSFRRPSINSLRRLQMSPIMATGSGHIAAPMTRQLSGSSLVTTSSSSRHRQTPSTSSVESTDTVSTNASTGMSRSRSDGSAVSGGLGFSFSSSASSRESLDFSSYASDHSSSSYLGSPDSSILSSPQTPPAAYAFGKKHSTESAYLAALSNNQVPPLPFFPFPGPSTDDDQHHQLPLQQQSFAGAVAAAMSSSVGSTGASSAAASCVSTGSLHRNQSIRRPGRNRSRASSMHTPVLETIMASPLLGGPGSPEMDAAPFAPSTPRNANFAGALGANRTAATTVTLKIKVPESNDNFLLRVERDSTYASVRDKISQKCISSHIDLADSFSITVQPGSSSKRFKKPSVDIAMASAALARSAGTEATTPDAEEPVDVVKRASETASQKELERSADAPEEEKTPLASTMLGKSADEGSLTAGRANRYFNVNSSKSSLMSFVSDDASGAPSSSSAGCDDAQTAGTSTSTAAPANENTIVLKDEDDWRLVVSLAGSKLTLRVA